jgi:hypothetical protein
VGRPSGARGASQRTVDQVTVQEERAGKARVSEIHGGEGVCQGPRRDWLSGAETIQAPRVPRRSARSSPPPTSPKGVCALNAPYGRQSREKLHRRARHRLGATGPGLCRHQIAEISGACIWKETAFQRPPSGKVDRAFHRQLPCRRLLTPDDVRCSSNDHHACPSSDLHDRRGRPV